jgi:cell wall assembly regulator SMI1
MKSMASEHRDRDITAALRRIARWIAGHAPGWSDGGGAPPLFNPPASAEALAELAAHLARPLPDDLRAMLLTSNGGRPGSYPLPMRATKPIKWRLLSAAEIAERWIFLHSVARDVRFEGVVRTVGPVRAVWWDAGWIPIADCGTGDAVCIDMDPAQGGVAGQLVLYAHDFAERKVLYRSALDWISESADDIEAGRYVYETGVGLVAAGH